MEKMTKTILFLLIFGFLYTVSMAGTVEYEGMKVTYNDEWSFKNFTNGYLGDKTIPRGIVIYASVFMQEKPDSHIFPEDMTDVTFVACNLDNVYIPEGNMVIGGSMKEFKVQNDGEDWVIDDQGQPVEPINKEAFEAVGVSTKPEDIPSKKSDLNIIERAREKIWERYVTNSSELL